MSEIQELTAEVRALRETIGQGTLADRTPRTHYTRSEAAEYLRLGLTKLDGFTKAGDIRAARMGDGPKAVLLYRRKDLDAFVESRLQLDKAGARKLARQSN